MANTIALNFNPRTHEGYDEDMELVKLCLCISIHVPTKGTTCKELKQYVHREISIHVPTKGTTMVIYCNGVIVEKFQSTYPRRVRLMCRP